MYQPFSERTLVSPHSGCRKSKSEKFRQIWLRENFGGGEKLAYTITSITVISLFPSVAFF